MKLSEIKGEAALDLLAEIIEPASEIIGDEEFKSMIGARKNNLTLAKYVLKKHKKPILHILALMDGKDPSNYNPSALSLPIKILELFNDPELVSLFTLQEQTPEPTPSGPAMEVTQA